GDYRSVSERKPRTIKRGGASMKIKGSVLTDLPRRALMGSAGILALAVSGHGALAQTSSGVEVGEVIVTATKRNERLRDVPTSVAVTTGDQLAAVGPVTNTADLISAVPGARFNNLANPL